MKKENEVKNAVKSNNGFTLIELLVVVLIIGILSAIALPGYKKAVEKSRVADALNTMQAVAKSEHGWYLTNNSYTKDFANLDIEINGTMNEGALETDFYTYELLDTGILAGRNNREYTIYQDYETKQIMCTPGNHYICENLGAFTKEPCEKVGMAWANTNSTCYVDEEERCLGLYADELGEDIWNENQQICGYYSNSTKITNNGKTLDEGMTCKAYDYGCKYSIVNAGATCDGIRGNQGCDHSTVNEGGVCKGGCMYSEINNGGKCIATGLNHCNYSTINAGGVCEGSGCQHVTLNGGTCSANSCNYAIINEGGVCSGSCLYARVNKGGKCTGTCDQTTVNDGGECSGNCGRATINSGGVCSSSPTNYCDYGHSGITAQYYGTGCCEGDYCGNKPKCNCPIDENTGKHLTSC